MPYNISPLPWQSQSQIRRIFLLHPAAFRAILRLAITNLCPKTQGAEKECIDMVKITVGVEGMQCGMCEAHVNDAVRKAFPVKKVTSSHTKNQTVILSEQPVGEQALRDVIRQAGYEMTSFTSGPYEKKGLFGLFH